MVGGFLGVHQTLEASFQTTEMVMLKRLFRDVGGKQHYSNRSQDHDGEHDGQAWGRFLVCGGRGRRGVLLLRHRWRAGVLVVFDGAIELMESQETPRNNSSHNTTSAPPHQAMDSADLTSKEDDNRDPIQTTSQQQPLASKQNPAKAQHRIIDIRINELTNKRNEDDVEKDKIIAITQKYYKYFSQKGLSRKIWENDQQGSY